MNADKSMEIHHPHRIVERVEECASCQVRKARKDKTRKFFGLLARRTSLPLFATGWLTLWARTVVWQAGPTLSGVACVFAVIGVVGWFVVGLVRSLDEVFF